MIRYFLFGAVGLYLWDNGNHDTYSDLLQIEIKLKDAIQSGDAVVLVWEEGVTRINEFLTLIQGYDGFVEIPCVLGRSL